MLDIGLPVDINYPNNDIIWGLTPKNKKFEATNFFHFEQNKKFDRHIL